jgi:hypothetical protein
MEISKKTAPVIQLLGTNYLPDPYVDESQLTDGEGVIYYGWAPLGVDEGDNGWRLMRKTINSGVTKCEYPNGSMGFEFNWKDRANYEYGR